jgi:hypothetical protein
MGVASPVYVLFNNSDNTIKGVYTDESEARVQLFFKTEETKQDHEIRLGHLVVTPTVVQL